MPGKLWNDVGNGKGSKRRIGSDPKKYADNWEKIFNATWPCPECGNSRTKGHEADCPNHWKNK